MTARTHPLHNNLSIFSDLEELSLFAAQHFFDACQRTLQETNRFCVALSGGSTPKRLYAILADAPWRSRLQWDLIHLFLVDERCVDYSHPDSNYRMIKQTLLDHIPIPPSNVHPVPILPDPATMAIEYERNIKEFFALNNRELPVFDLIFLGIGDDGHTASLFPHSEALKIRVDRLVTANFVKKLGAYRITLTVPVLNNAKEGIFLISGASKQRALREIIAGDFRPEEYPAQLIKPTGQLLYLADEAAAADLERNANRR